ncbi:MAG: hypothetical protein IKJ52_06915 [Muribaculaceae bacterium]|nr:hypothetical protein [Muribaculaceae bacterium]
MKKIMAMIKKIIVTMLSGFKLEKSVVLKMTEDKIKITIKVSIFLFLIMLLCDKI